MGRLLDEFLERHNLSDAVALSLLGTGCITLLLDDDIPIAVKARVEETEQDAHRVVENAASILFSTKGRFHIDPTFKDRE